MGSREWGVGKKEARCRSRQPLLPIPHSLLPTPLFLDEEKRRMLDAPLARTERSVRLGFVRAEGQTAVGSLRQSGSARVRFPKPVARADPEAVLLNMAGGLTGGDRIDVDVTVAARAAATVTSAAAEKIYRALDGKA